MKKLYSQEPYIPPNSQGTGIKAYDDFMDSQKNYPKKKVTYIPYYKPVPFTIQDKAAFITTKLNEFLSKNGLTIKGVWTRETSWANFDIIHPKNTFYVTVPYHRLNEALSETTDSIISNAISHFKAFNIEVTP